MEDAEFARWSRAVLALLSRASGEMSSKEIAEEIGDCDELTLESVLQEMAARGLIRPDPGQTSSAGSNRWRSR